MAVNVKPVNHRYQPLPTTINRCRNNRITASFNEFTINKEFKNTIKSTRFAKSLTNLMNTYIEKQSLKKDFFQFDNQNVVALYNSMQEKPMTSRKENFSKIWLEIHGENDWGRVLDPLDENVRSEIVK